MRKRGSSQEPQEAQADITEAATHRGETRDSRVCLSLTETEVPCRTHAEKEHTLTCITEMPDCNAQTLPQGMEAKCHHTALKNHIQRLTFVPVTHLLPSHTSRITALPTLKQTGRVRSDICALIYLSLLVYENFIHLWLYHLTLNKSFQKLLCPYFSGF